MKIYLEDVFKTSGTPTYTFVKPQEYTKLIVSLWTKGRGLIIEGPSGIGKTTSINKALEEVGLRKSVSSFSSRKKEDIESPGDFFGQRNPELSPLTSPPDTPQ